MKQIPLTQGKVALVDDADFQHFNQWKWLALKGRNNKWYAARMPSRRLGKRKWIFMHNEIMGTPPGLETDHIDGDGLNNQRRNLRDATHAQNSKNRRMRSDNKTGYKGVTKIGNSYNAILVSDYKVVLNKSFSTAEEAARAYDEAAKKHHGPFANLNFPD